MKKLAEYFSNKKNPNVSTGSAIIASNSNNNINNKKSPGANHLEDFPQFNENEEKEIRKVLNIRANADARSVILETLTTFKELPIAASDKEGKQVAVVKNDEEDDEEDEEAFATFKVNLASRGLKSS